ncbi:hypothetical protein TBR22_A52610 [Luteitalea sp. TBR-22]|uniref:PEP-CTERM sorting domain-containing protein n=1 Tax=Luteitalea sp. TBR-22 TaxID=2802971 RepID=UPI001AFBC88F|nr:PEP-CTERM sorting domain-containing protein [Luteitalea sp. TBR-22]BCS36024.1 hypothetical protein TBR22_A52610 [Luteitalea sp. TBR-22]
MQTHPPGIGVVTIMRSRSVVVLTFIALVSLPVATYGQPVSSAPATCVADCEPPAVPEPATLVLLGLGLFGAGIATRRRRS